MRKYFAIIAAITTFGMGPASAQYQEAVLQKIEVKNAGFDLVIATTKPGGWSFDPQHQSWAHLVYVGNKLAHPITNEMVELTRGVGALSLPTCAFDVQEGRNKQSPVAIYAVPKDAQRRASMLQVR